MLVRLVLETAFHHSAADPDRLVLMEAASLDDYCSLLARIHGFEVPLERDASHPARIVAAANEALIDPAFAREPRLGAIITPPMPIGNNAQLMQRVRRQHA